MGGMSIWHWLVVALVVMLLFGRGKVSDLMGDVAKGIKSFKKGLADDEVPPTTTSEQQKSIDGGTKATVDESQRSKVG